MNPTRSQLQPGADRSVEPMAGRRSGASASAHMAAGQGCRQLSAAARSSLFALVVLAFAALHGGLVLLTPVRLATEEGDGLAIRLPLSPPADYRPVELSPAVPAQELLAGLALAGWSGMQTIAGLTPPEPVPPLLLRRLPANLAGEPEAARQALFIALLLPLLLHVNGEIAAERLRVAAIMASQRAAATTEPQLSAEDRDVLARIARRYRLRLADPARPRDDELATLLQRVAPLPVALGLAQAAIESAWGGSRFAREGNALFGEWTYDSRIGIVPLEREEGRNHLVRKFPTLLDAVRSWALLLNTGEAYAGFRAERARLAMAPNRTAGRDPATAKGGSDGAFSGEATRMLARTLTAYSERRGAYVEDVVRMVDRHRLDRFEATRLALSVTVPSPLLAALHKPRPPVEAASSETACTGPRC